jgi:hypothetical protein
MPKAKTAAPAATPETNTTPNAEGAGAQPTEQGNPTTNPRDTAEQGFAQASSAVAAAESTAKVYDGPEPTMVNGVYVGPKAEAKPERSLYERINEAFPNARQTAVLSELVNRLIVLEAHIFDGREDGAQK